MIDLGVLNRGFSSLGAQAAQTGFVQRARDVHNSSCACINAIRDFLTKWLFPETYREQQAEMQEISQIVESSLMAMNQAISVAGIIENGQQKQLSCELCIGKKIYLMRATEKNGSTELVFQPKREGIYLDINDYAQAVEIDPDEISTLSLDNTTIETLKQRMNSEVEVLLRSDSPTALVRWQQIEHCFDQANSAAAFKVLNDMHRPGLSINDEIHAFVRLANLAIPPSPLHPGFRKQFQISLDASAQKAGHSKIAIHLKMGEQTFSRQTCDVADVAETLLGFDSMSDTVTAAYNDQLREQIQAKFLRTRTLAPDRIKNLSAPEKALLTKMLLVMYRNGGHFFEQDENYDNICMRRAMYDATAHDMYKVYRPGEKLTAGAVEFNDLNEQVVLLHHSPDLQCLDYGATNIHTKFNQIGYIEDDEGVRFTMVEPLIKALCNPHPLLDPDDSGVNQNLLGATLQAYAESTADYEQFRQDSAVIQTKLTTLYRAHDNTLHISSKGMDRNRLIE